MYSEEKKKLAYNLRKEGYGVKEISQKLNIAKSTSSQWCKKMALTDEEKRNIEIRQKEKYDLAREKGKKTIAKKARQLRESNTKNGLNKVKKLSKRDLLMLGIGLYWGEGSKGEHTVSISNMDPDIFVVFIKWIELLGFKKNQLSAKLNLSTELNEKEEIDWWCSKIGIEKKVFTKTTKIVTGSKRSENYHGILTLRICNTGLLHKIYGMIDACRDIE